MAWLWLCTGGTVQLASVTGRIECPSDPNRIFNVTVKLDELDTGKLISFKLLLPIIPLKNSCVLPAPIRYIHMDNTSTNESGEFALSGIAADLLGTIDAVVRVS